MLDKAIKILAIISSIIAISASLGWHNSALQANDLTQEKAGLTLYVKALHAHK